jgi:hypothetical protein
MVSWGSREVGKTPTSFEAPAGNDKIELIARLDGYDDAPFTVNPLIDAKGKDRPVWVQLRKPRQGTAPKRIPKKPGAGSAGTGSAEQGSDEDIPW